MDSDTRGNIEHHNGNPVLSGANNTEPPLPEDLYVAIKKAVAALYEHSAYLLSDYTALCNEFCAVKGEGYISSCITTAITNHEIFLSKLDALTDQMAARLEDDGTLTDEEQKAWLAGLNEDNEQFWKLREEYGTQVEKVAALRKRLEAARRGEGGVYDYPAGMESYKVIGNQSAGEKSKKRRKSTKLEKGSDVESDKDNIFVSEGRKKKIKRKHHSSMPKSSQRITPSQHQANLSQIAHVFNNDDEKGNDSRSVGDLDPIEAAPFQVAESIRQSSASPQIFRRQPGTSSQTMRKPSYIERVFIDEDSEEGVATPVRLPVALQRDSTPARVLSTQTLSLSQPIRKRSNIEKAFITSDDDDDGDHFHVHEEVVPVQPSATVQNSLAPFWGPGMQQDSQNPAKPSAASLNGLYDNGDEGDEVNSPASQTPAIQAPSVSCWGAAGAQGSSVPPKRSPASINGLYDNDDNEEGEEITDGFDLESVTDPASAVNQRSVLTSAPAFGTQATQPTAAKADSIQSNCASLLDELNESACTDGIRAPPNDIGRDVSFEMAIALSSPTIRNGNSSVISSTPGFTPLAPFASQMTQQEIEALFDDNGSSPSRARSAPVRTWENNEEDEDNDGGVGGVCDNEGVATYLNSPTPSPPRKPSPLGASVHKVMASPATASLAPNHIYTPTNSTTLTRNAVPSPHALKSSPAVETSHGPGFLHPPAAKRCIPRALLNSISKPGLLVPSTANPNSFTNTAGFDSGVETGLMYSSMQDEMSSSRAGGEMSGEMSRGGEVGDGVGAGRRGAAGGKFGRYEREMQSITGEISPSAPARKHSQTSQGTTKTQVQALQSELDALKKQHSKLGEMIGEFQGKLDEILGGKARGRRGL